MLDLSSPVVMGVLNVTPDSFSDGGRFQLQDDALRHAASMHAAGAAIIDVGGESTRPGAEAVTAQQEIDRVVPVVERLTAELPVAISVDTSKASVMRAAAAAGAALINDVRALQTDGALATAAELRLPVCLMHMQGDPQTMQDDPSYQNVVADVTAFLADRIADCERAGIERGGIVIDPGFGFGKTPAQNMALLANLDQFCELGCPVLIGISRKSTLGVLTDRAVEGRLAASVAAATAAVLNGASIVRAHDVAETVDAVRIAVSLREAGGQA